MIHTLFFILVTSASFLNPLFMQADIVDDMAAHFRNGNAKEIARNFAPTLELIIVDEEDVYSKVQSEQILRDFFNKHKPVKVSILHNINNNSSNRFGVLLLNTGKGNFRVSITMKKNGAVYLINELRIEPAKE